jgi:hypothetical protein
MLEERASGEMFIIGTATGMGLKSSFADCAAAQSGSSVVVKRRSRLREVGTIKKRVLH